MAWDGVKIQSMEAHKLLEYLASPHMQRDTHTHAMTVLCELIDALMQNASKGNTAMTTMQAKKYKSHLLETDIAEMVANMQAMSTESGTTKQDLLLVYNEFKQSVQALDDDFLYLCRVNRRPSQAKTALYKALFSYLDRFNKLETIQ